ncbi:MAG: hypothetical protein ABJD97_18865 [Betaproteobacteria bacterium]
MTSPYRKLLSAIGLGVAASNAIAAPAFQPYANEGIDSIYNLLFCDDIKAFAPKRGQAPTPWQQVLFSEPADTEALQRLAGDSAQEGRVRFLACSRLRKLGSPVQPKIILAVIIEAPLAGGLDTLAAFSEGGVRYINQTGKLAVVESLPTIRPMVQRLFEAAKPVVARIGAWDKPRLAPPAAGCIRLSFLVSDGLYFGQGPMSVMQGEPLAAPVIREATKLLQAVVAASAR